MRTPADVRTSKFLSLVLRHDPARIGITLDAGGWVAVPVLRVDAAAMHADGHRFLVSANGVWLTDAVPARYLTLVKES